MFVRCAELGQQIWGGELSKQKAKNSHELLLEMHVMRGKSLGAQRLKGGVPDVQEEREPEASGETEEEKQERHEAVSSKTFGCAGVGGWREGKRIS